MLQSSPRRFSTSTGSFRGPSDVPGRLHEDLNRASPPSEPPSTPECTLEMSEEKGIERIAAEFWK